MYSALFPAPPHLLLRKLPGEVQYKVKNRPGNAHPGCWWRSPVFAQQLRGTLCLTHTARFRWQQRESMTCDESRIFRRTSDDAPYALILEAIILLALCSSISNV